jgi:pyrrolidone-carboxylate peptidase
MAQRSGSVAQGAHEGADVSAATRGRGDSTSELIPALLDLQRFAGNRSVGRMLGGLRIQPKLAPGAENGGGEPLDAAAAEPATEPGPESPGSAAASTAPLVDDEAERLEPGQMRKSEFFAQLRPALCAAAEEGFAGTQYQARHCPLIERYLGTYERRDAARINRDLPRFAGEGPRPRHAAGYIALIAGRVRAGTAHWARTGQVTGVPRDLPLPDMEMPGGIFFKARPGGAQRADPWAVRDELGAGQPLDASVRTRMESAFGASFGHVRVHADGHAGSVASRLNARAFTVGEHVAFGDQEYRPGSLVGDALIAHELAHVTQQGVAPGAGHAALPKSSDGHADGDLEHSADLAAIGAVTALWGGRRGPRAVSRPRLATALRLQRCSGCSGCGTSQTPQVQSPPQPASVPDQILAASGFDRRPPAFRRALAGATDLASAHAVVQSHGTSLWEAARARSQQAPGTRDTDDRPLFWARERMVEILRQWQPGFALAQNDRDALVKVLEQSSRGMGAGADFQNTATGVKHVLVSGFDPFGLDPQDPTWGGTGNPARGNPSGAAAIALDGQAVTNTTTGDRGEIQGVVFPVRFADFNQGVVEGFFRPFLTRSPPVNMIMTISQGGGQSPTPFGEQFEFEEWAGRRRSTTASDNLGQQGSGTDVQGRPGIASDTTPVEPPGLAPGPEFLPTELTPRDAMRRELGRTSATFEESYLREIPQGSSTPDPPRTGRPTANSTSVEGSGSGYLSNEIFYRVTLLRRDTRSSVPVGHLHTPLLEPPGSGISDSTFVNRRNQIVDQVKRLVEAALPSI